MQRDAGVPSTIVMIVDALLILALVAVQGLRLRRPPLDVLPVALPDARASEGRA